jgi:hypothetical protein
MGEGISEIDELYICYRVYLVVKSREMGRKGEALCQNGKRGLGRG